MKNILILCTGNSCRSQMAEGWMKYYAKGVANIYSAGIEAHGLNPYAVKVMSDAIIEIQNQTSNVVDEYLDIDFDYIITVCDNASDKCPVFPKKTTVIHHGFDDPAKFEGSEEEKLAKFAVVRDQIDDFCFSFVNDNVKKLVG